MTRITKIKDLYRGCGNFTFNINKLLVIHKILLGWKIGWSLSTVGEFLIRMWICGIVIGTKGGVC